MKLLKTLYLLSSLLLVGCGLNLDIHCLDVLTQQQCDNLSRVVSCDTLFGASVCAQLTDPEAATCESLMGVEYCDAILARQSNTCEYFIDTADDGVTMIGTIFVCNVPDADTPIVYSCTVNEDAGLTCTQISL